MDVGLIKYLSVILGICSATSTAYFLRKHVGNDRKIEFLESARRINDLRDLAQELNSSFHCAVTGEVGCADLTGLGGVMVERTVKEHYHQLDINIKRRVTKGILMPKRKADISDSWRRSSKIQSSVLIEVPWHLDDGTGRVAVDGAASADFEVPFLSSLTIRYGPHRTPVHYPYSTRSSFEEWDRALIHETEDCIQVSKIIALEMIERALPVQTFLTVVGQVTNTNAGLTIGRSGEWPLLISQLTIDEQIANLVNFERWPERAWLGLTVCCAAIYIICYISEDGIAANCAPVLRRLQRGLYMG